MTMRIRLDTISKVKKFVQLADCYDGIVEVSSGSGMVNGKSILGILSLDLSNELDVRIEAKEDSHCFLEKMQACGLHMEEIQG